ncbi:MAG TPA: hypothetical protein PKE17_19665 [Saprospiraceae bacterium]|nr:hypothetical protein [Saprospiraceae bacterium]
MNIVFCASVAFSPAYANDNAPLVSEISRIENTQSSHRYQKDAELQALISSVTNSEDMGRVYYALAHNIYSAGSEYSQVEKSNRYEKIIAYSEEACKYPLNPLDQCELYSYLYSALRGKYNIGRSSQYVDQRSEMVVPALRGLKVVSEYLTIKEKQPRIKGFVYNGDGDTNSALYRQKMSEMNALIEQQNQIIFQNKLLEYRDKFFSWVIDLYSQPPDALSELDKLASNIIGHPATIVELLDETRYARERFVPNVQSNTNKPAPRRDMPPSID